MTRELPPDCTHRFRVAELIGEGGYGEVYRATQLQLDRTVALKVLRAGRSNDPEDLQRFLAEARITAGLSHPGIVIVIDFGHAAGLPWIAYEYLPGPSLAKLIAKGPLEPARALGAGAQIAHALHHAHQKGVLHRDVKPDNVVEVERDRYKIGDFGIAKWSGAGEVHTRTGLVVGSPAYIAPELIAGGRASARSDIYALGISLYEILTGRPPFDSLNIMDVLQGHLKGTAPPLSEVLPGIPAPLSQLVERAMDREPSRRHASAAELAEALEACAAGRPIEPARARPRAARGSGTSVIANVPPVRPARLALVALATVFVTLTAGGALLFWLRARGTPPDAPPAIERVVHPEPGRLEVRLSGKVPPALAARLEISPAPGFPATMKDGEVDASTGRISFAGLAPGRRGTLQVTVPGRTLALSLRTPRATAVRGVDLLTSTSALQVYFQYCGPDALLVEVKDDKGALTGRAVAEAGGREFVRVFTSLSRDRDYRLSIRPERGWGDTVELDVRTHGVASLGEMSRDILRSDGLKGGQFDTITRDLVAALSGEKGGNDAVLSLWSLGKLSRVVRRLVQMERRYMPRGPMLKAIEGTPELRPDDMNSVCDLVRDCHDGKLLDALDKRLVQELPHLRPVLLGAALQAAWPGADPLARETLAAGTPYGLQYFNPAIVLRGRALPQNADGVRELARGLEAAKNTYGIEVAQALIDLEPEAARELFGAWLPSGRGDLALIAIAGFSLLGEDADVRALAPLLAKRPLVGTRPIAAMRYLADLGTPAARTALAKALDANPFCAAAIWGAARVGLSSSQPALEQALATGNEPVRLAAAAALGSLGSPAAQVPLVKALADPSAGVRRNAAWALGQLAGRPAPPELRAYALSADDATGVGAWALGRAGDASSALQLFALFERVRAAPRGSPEWARAAVMAYALRLLDHAPARPTLDQLAAASSWDLMQVCASRKPGAPRPGVVEAVRFPFIVHQRLGVRVPRGQVMIARAEGYWGAGDNPLRYSTDISHLPGGGAIREGLLIGHGAQLMERAPHVFVAPRDQELALTALPFNELHDLAQTDSLNLRGLSFVQIELRSAPAR